MYYFTHGSSFIWALSPFSWNTASVETKSELKVKSVFVDEYDRRKPRALSFVVRKFMLQSIGENLVPYLCNHKPLRCIIIIIM